MNDEKQRPRKLPPKVPVKPRFIPLNSVISSE